MAIFQAVIDFHASNRQQKEGAYKRLYVSIKKNEVSLPLGRGRSGYEIRSVLRLVVSLQRKFQC